MKNPTRVLCVGREVGPLVHLLRETVPNLQIGAVDVLANEDTRQYADWAFSVEKQNENTSICRPKLRSLEELLYELAQVMMEEISFDLVIPSSPFQTRLDYLEGMSKQTETFMPDRSTLEQTTTAFKFLSSIETCSPSLLHHVEGEVALSELETDDLPGILITKDGNYFLNEKTASSNLRSRTLKGFYVTTSQIHCASFLVSTHNSQFLGVQTLDPPYQHTFFPNLLERNSILPYSASGVSSLSEIMDYGRNLIHSLDLSGMITFYFCHSSRYLVPFSCNLLPDENLGLWARNHPRVITQFLTTPSHILGQPSPKVDFAYRIPIHSRRPLIVPSLPKRISNQRNFAGVLSHPEYPICAISGSDTSPHEAEKQKTEVLAKLTQIFEPSSQHSVLEV